MLPQLSLPKRTLRPSEATTATTVTIISNTSGNTTHLPWPQEAIKHAIRKRHLAEEGAHVPAFEALSKPMARKAIKTAIESGIWLRRELMDQLLKLFLNLL
ncbi:hypothetical protein Tco_0588631 [Tanacetum coccineum]